MAPVNTSIPDSPSPSSGELIDKVASTAEFKTSVGIDTRANVLKLTPQSVILEVCAPESVVRLSEVVEQVRIRAEDRLIYDGQAVVSSVARSGTTTVFEASFRAALDLDLSLIQKPAAVVPGAFKSFYQRWRTFNRVSPEFKLVVTDIESFLHELRLWLDQLEMRIGGSPEQRARVERAVLEALPANPVLYGLFERFETIAASIPEELVPAHRAFAQRQLHSLLLCAPFLHRTYAKPLGYAGDYEMMNMMVRNEPEGPSLYAKVINSYLLSQVAPQAVRNRVNFLHGKIVDETSRVARQGGIARIFCIACGPAWEAQNFISDSPLADHASFRMLDFNEETLQFAGRKLEEARHRNTRKASVELVNNSVHHLLKARRKSSEQGYDLIYCSGLYDYLNNRVVKALNTYLYDQLLPGGLLVVGNFATGTPVRFFMEHFAEWFLIYRDASQLAALAPEQAAPEQCNVVSELTGANIFLEARKPG